MKIMKPALEIYKETVTALKVPSKERPILKRRIFNQRHWFLTHIAGIPRRIGCSKLGMKKREQMLQEL